MELRTKAGTLVATGWTRIVSNTHPRHRGSYVEFTWSQAATDDMRMVPGHLYFYEWRTIPDNMMVYEQRRTVGYADYVPHRWYVSVEDLDPSWQFDDEL